MPGSSQPRKRILFVDDDERYLEVLHQMVELWGKNEWEVHLATSASQALALIAKTAIDLVVLDVQMPVIDGIQFLGLLQRKHPHLQKVVLTGYTNEAYRTACLNGGAELFLEKPRSAEAIEGVFAALRELAKWQPEEDGFRGVLRSVGLSDVIQMECLSRHSVTLDISAEGLSGKVFIREGSIIHAEAPGKKGLEAFNFLLSFRGGRFKLDPFVEPAAITIEGSWEFLVMEASRLRDEGMQSGAAAAAEPAPEDIIPAEEEIKNNSPAEAATKAVAVPAVPSSPRPLLQHRIEEMLICSGDGEVIYEWQCPHTDERINFLEVISRKSQQLAQGLGLGHMDRIEMENAQGRMVMHVGNERGVLVRSTQVLPEGARGPSSGRIAK
jgi:CheY-like chemotaxis protein